MSEIIAKDFTNGMEYEFRVGRIHDPESLQMTHRVEMRRVGSELDWESAMVGMATSRRDAIRFFAERYQRIGTNIEDLEVFDETLGGFVEEEIEAGRKKEADRKVREQERQAEADRADEALQRRMANEKEIAERMKKVRAKKVDIEITVVYQKSESTEIVKALRIGDYAYHKDWERETYGVTHIETGRAVEGGLLWKQARELTYRMSLLSTPPEGFLKEAKKVIDAFYCRDLIADAITVGG